MYIKVIKNNKVSRKKRVKYLLEYYRVKKGTAAGWKKRFKTVFERNPGFQQKINPDIEAEHQKKWGVFSGSINPETIRLCSNNSGIKNINIVPEEIFATDIEFSLNGKTDYSLIAHKSLYDKWFPDGFFPKSYLHSIKGNMYDSTYTQLNPSQLAQYEEKIQYPVILKPNTGTYGGYGVYKLNDGKELYEKIRGEKNFIIQEFIKQHAFFEQFNDHGINSIRVNVYRSIEDNQLHILNAALRMGVGGSLDNETAGGIVVHINRNGKLCGIARDKFATRYYQHPDTEIAFNSEIPFYNELIQTTLTLATCVPFLRLMSFDMCLDKNNKWRAIEVNSTGQTIRFAQYAGEPFFREFTDEVIEYCMVNHWALT